MKNTLKKKVLISVGAAAIVIGSGLAVAGGKHCDGGEHGGKYGGKFGGEHRVERMAKYLDLTPKQQESIKTLMAEKREEGEDHRELRKEFREDLHELDPASPTYLNDVKVLAGKQSDAMAEKMVDMAEMKMELYAILTPAQIEKMESMKERKQKRFDDDDYRGGHHW